MTKEKEMIVKATIRCIPLLSVVLLSLLSAGFGKDVVSETELTPQTTPHADNIRFEEEVVYSEPDGIMFGAITTSTTDRSGLVFMGDNDQKKIHIFNSDGSYLHSFGSQGNGPGEFQMITKIAVDDTYVHVFDLIQGRINLFDINNFNFIRTIALTENGGRIQRGAAANSGMGRPFDFHLLTDGNYLISYRSFMDINRPRTAIVSPEGEVLEKDRFEFRSNEDEFTENSSGNRRIVATFPFSRTTRLTVSPNGLVISNWSEYLEFDLYDESGNHTRTFSYPFQNAQMDRREVLKMYENMQPQGQGVIMGGRGSGGGPPPIEQVLENMEFPDTWPAVDKIYADAQNRLWVSSFTEKSNERHWFLFDESGDLTGTFIWPASRSIVHAEGNTVYVLDRPADDLDRVIRYRFKP